MKLFGLGKMTLRSVFRKPETHMYPFAPTPDLARRRGSVAIGVGDCVFCGMCARACPADAIEVDRKAGTWAVNHFSCVQCASCVDACPKDCLHMKANVPSVGTVVASETFSASAGEEEPGVAVV